MIFTELPISGAYIIKPQSHVDDRGHFARLFCATEFNAQGLTCGFVQCSISHNHQRGTLRGLHYQVAPYEEIKLVSCSRGALFDVIVDVRPDSPSYGNWYGVELSHENRAMLYVPAGCAHGFQTLVDDTDVYYMISEFYQPSAARRIHWRDNNYGIHWPMTPSVISAEDDSAGDRKD